MNNPRTSPKYSTRSLKRQVILSDDHTLIGRIFKLSIVELNFESYEELAGFPDCRYVFHCNQSLSNLVRCVESLNLVGDLIWIEPKEWGGRKLPVDRFNWLNFVADAFLMRLISVFDCVLLRTNNIYELGLAPHKCTFGELSKRGLPRNLAGLFVAMREEHEPLRTERNSRVHHGYERAHSSCDQSFRVAAMFEHRGQSLEGVDSNGRRISVDRLMKEGLVRLQRDHNKALRSLARQLDQIYDLLEKEFENRFSEKFNDPTTGFGYRERIQSRK